MAMSKDRVAFVLTNRNQTRPYATLCRKVFGLPTSDFWAVNHKGRNIEIICRPSQFSRFIIERNAMTNNGESISNSFKELAPCLISNEEAQSRMEGDLHEVWFMAGGTVPTVYLQLNKPSSEVLRHVRAALDGMCFSRPEVPAYTFSEIWRGVETSGVVLLLTPAMLGKILFTPMANTRLADVSDFGSHGLASDDAKIQEARKVKRTTVKNCFDVSMFPSSNT